MPKHRTLSVIMAVAALGLSAPLLAQGRTAVSGAELDAAVAARPAGNREAVQMILATDQAKQVASQMGVDIAELSALVGILDEATLNRLAEQAGIDDRTLAGGANTIVITTTTVIIVLLIVIILLLD